MDEATSALDNVTEKHITEAVARLKGERTILVIAHRLTTIQNCDEIIFMEDGKITDVGKYGELITRNDEFKEMEL